MAVPYDEAVTTLREMFTDLDEEVVVAILEDNGRHMERTVECILAMLGELNDEEVSELDEGSRRAHEVEGAQLPDDFLSYRTQGEAASPQMMEDAALAQKLQLEEMRAPRVTHPARQDRQSRHHPSHQPAPPATAAAVGTDSTSAPVEHKKTWSERWSNFGEATKKKFRQWATNFRGNSRPPPIERTQYAAIPAESQDEEMEELVVPAAENEEEKETNEGNNVDPRTTRHDDTKKDR